MILIDRFGIYKKNKLKSPVSQYSGKKDWKQDKWAIGDWPLDSLPSNIGFSWQPSKEIHKLGTFCFESRVQDNGEENRVCRGEYYQNEKGSNVDVIVVHGWKSSSLKSVKKLLLEPLLAEGYNIFFMELPHHLPYKCKQYGAFGLEQRHCQTYQEGLWTSWGKPDRLVMPCGHSGLNVYRKPISDAICRFVRIVL